VSWGDPSGLKKGAHRVVERTLQGCHCISSSRRCRRRRTADGTQTTTGNVITAAQKQWDSWVTREAKARSTVVSHGIQAEIEYMWSANDIYRPSAPHTRWTPLPVAPTSLRAFHHHSDSYCDSYCDNLHKLMQSGKSATPKTRTIHSIILSTHFTGKHNGTAVILASSRSGSDARRTCKYGKIQSLGGCSSIVQHASNGSTLGLLRDRQAVSMQSSIGA